MCTQSSTDSNQGAPMLQVSRLIHQFVAVLHCDRNVIEIPPSYHRQWAPFYPPKVLFQHNGYKWIITVRKDGNKFYFADGLKEFRKAMGIHEGVTITFTAIDRYWDLHIHVPPEHQQTCGRPLATARRHVWTVELTEELVSGAQPLVLPMHFLQYLQTSRRSMKILGHSGSKMKWTLLIHDRKKGQRCVADDWYDFCDAKELDAGDDVCFYYRPRQKVWEIIIREDTPWVEPDHE